MDDEFNMWDCSWYWDNSFADLSPVGLTYVSQRNKSSTHANQLLLVDSAFCELEADSVASRNVTQLDQLGLLHAFGDGRGFRHDWIEKSPKIDPHYDDYDDLSSSSKVVDSQSVAESFDSGSSNVEEMEMSDTDSLCRSTEWSDSSSVMELASSCCHSDKSTASSNPDTSCKNEQVADESQLSNVNFSENTHFASLSNMSSATVGNESQLAQHQPLVFFITGLFVGLSLGFFTCIVIMSAAVHRMHLEIVSGRTLYAECQHKRELCHKYVFSEVPKVNIDVVIESIWRTKFEEMVVENAELQVKLSLLENQMSCVLNKMQHNITELSSEVMRLKYCIDDDIFSLTGDIHSLFANENSSSTDTVS